jgi:hypothetical protein
VRSFWEAGKIKKKKKEKNGQVVAKKGRIAQCGLIKQM